MTIPLPPLAVTKKPIFATVSIASPWALKIKPAAWIERNYTTLYSFVEAISETAFLVFKFVHSVQLAQNQPISSHIGDHESVSDTG